MMTSRRYPFLVLALALMATGLSCNPSDPGCVSDSECRQGRLCVEGACTGEVPNEPDPALRSSSRSCCRPAPAGARRRRRQG